MQVGEYLAAHSGGKNPYVHKVEEAGGFDKLLGLQNHADDKVYRKASLIIRKFFDSLTEDEEDEDEEEDYSESTSTNFELNMEESPAPEIPEMGQFMFEFDVNQT